MENLICIEFPVVELHLNVSYVLDVATCINTAEIKNIVSIDIKSFYIEVRQSFCGTAECTAVRNSNKILFV